MIARPFVRHGFFSIEDIRAGEFPHLIEKVAEFGRSILPFAKLMSPKCTKLRFRTPGNRRLEVFFRRENLVNFSSIFRQSDGAFLSSPEPGARGARAEGL